MSDEIIDDVVTNDEDNGHRKMSFRKARLTREANKFDCITCGYNNEDENFLIEKTGEIVCDNCMTVEQHNLWGCQNFAYNPDSYDDGAPCPPELECGHFVPCDECQGDITVGDEPCYACAYAGGKKTGDSQ